MINIGTCVNFLTNTNLLNSDKEPEMSNTHQPTYRYPTSVTFCITGNVYTTGFFNSWTGLLFYLKENPSLINPHFINYHSENIYEARNYMLGGDPSLGKWQLPLIEDYDSKYIFFIDSNMVFNPMQVMQIIYKMIKFDLDILSAVCVQNDNVTTNVLSDDSEEYLIKNGKFEFYKKQELISLGLKAENNLVEVSNVGLNLICIKNELFEKIDYPWFEPELYKNLKGFYSADHSIIRKFKNIDIKVLCDTSLIVGRDTTVTIK